MSYRSAARVRIKAYGYEYRFCGVTSVRHTLSLQLASDAGSATESGFVNGAKPQPDKVTLSVVETDLEQSGRAARMIEALDAVRRSRALCRVITSVRTYDNMLLSEITATQDETNPHGWSGTLTFTRAAAVTWNPKAAAAGTSASRAASCPNTNASVAVHTGAAAARTLSGTALDRMLARAGIGGPEQENA